MYDTDPVGEVLDQPNFLNACVRVRTSLDPEELLETCKLVEREIGREFPVERHGPRVVDIDVLLLDQVIHRSSRLRLPHPEVLARRFVLIPLLELDPSLALPDGTRAADALETLAGLESVRWAGAALVSDP